MWRLHLAFSSHSIKMPLATIFYSLSLFNRLLYVGQCFFNVWIQGFLCYVWQATQHMLQSLSQFPSKLSLFFLCSCTQKVFICFMWCRDYLSHCPAVWVGEATLCLHGNSVQGSAYCRCTLLRCKNAVNWCIVTGLQSWLFTLCWFFFMLKHVCVCRHIHCPPTLLSYFL